MREMIRKITSPEVVSTFAMMLVAVIAFAMPEVVLAASQGVKGITGAQEFKDVITLAFGIFAFVKWMDYIANFTPNGALFNLIVPALATFLAFKWADVLKWFDLAK